MRATLDLVLFGAVFAGSFFVFQSLAYAGLAGLILACAGDAALWPVQPKND